LDPAVVLVELRLVTVAQVGAARRAVAVVRRQQGVALEYLPVVRVAIPQVEPEAQRAVRVVRPRERRVRAAAIRTTPATIHRHRATS
jgi:hypothetical protein